MIVVKLVFRMFMLATFFVAGEAVAQTRIEYLGKGTEYEAPVYVYVGAEPGPVVLVQGGIHGSELSGMLAIENLRDKFEIHKGTVILIPCMNFPACRRETRFVNVDLNRVFGKVDDGASYEYRLADEISNLVSRWSVEYLLTMHDSKLLHDPLLRQNYGQTICYGVKPKPAILDVWIAALNQYATEPNERFRPFYSPVPGSSTEVLVERHRLKGGFCGETWLGLPVARRSYLQGRMMLSLLDVVGVKYRVRNLVAN